MHMNSAPHLLSEDRADFERILDEALRQAHDDAELSAAGQRLNSEQLRTMALSATALITSSAAAEYEHFAKIREEFRSPAPSSSSVHDAASTPSGSETPDAGAGLAAVITVLAPVLGGTAAVIFLLVGYLLKALSPPPAFARSLVAVGWFFTAVTVVGILVAAIGLLVTALRNTATQLPSEEPWGGELPDEVARAREAWRQALLERGILPFLRAALAAPSAGTPAAPRPAQPVKHLPKIGYSRPDFSSPDEGSTAGQRPTFSSPDFSSPDFGGPEHRPE
ncbi:hypothetical protein OIE62_20885 [Streptomyces scopuliridis]|uniref:Uncharacterized protein n=1 Tax=Streptomyces scopuliridis TaxID=452529 RepID=A0ACD4ZPR0_9ACTN|nr:hypothetical protein [Streptomyces scopuliridis]WSB99091.1 hypothetical protein OG835_20060 [Streptomyces scopuliridis]WSC07207.1 hypothetical protein OIE62_20885 [Streptomyces scopuliridis]